MNGLIGKKLGMTSVFDGLGRHIPVTVIEVEPCVVTQVKTVESDGYSAVQIAGFEKKAKNTTKALQGHFKKAETTPKRIVREFRDFSIEGISIGDTLNLTDVFNIGDIVDVVSKTKGRGFSGVVKRHNFGGVGQSTHGQHNRLRAPGSIGQSSDPSRVFKGMRMAGRYGNERVKIKNLSIANIMEESNVILVTGSIPGAKGSVVEIFNKSIEG